MHTRMRRRVESMIQVKHTPSLIYLVLSFQLLKEVSLRSRANIELVKLRSSTNGNQLISSSLDLLFLKSFNEKLLKQMETMLSYDPNTSLANSLVIFSLASQSRPSNN